MKRYMISAFLIIVLTGLAVISLAADVMQSPEGKLFVIEARDSKGITPADFYAQYEKSWATAAFVIVAWSKCESSDPGTGASKYDFSSLDNDPLANSAKTKICSIDMGNFWAEMNNQNDPDRYWQLADAFLAAAVKRANEMGITYFEVMGHQGKRSDWALIYVESLKHAYRAIKAVSANNVVIGGIFGSGINSGVQALYDAGGKGYFDVLGVSTRSGGPRTGVDVFDIVAEHRKMEKNGDGSKQMFVIEGWEASAADADALRLTIENGYRNILTDRDIYDPKWVLGARMEIRVDDNSALSSVLSSTPPQIPEHNFDATLLSNDLLFNYLTDKPYKLTSRIYGFKTQSAIINEFNVRRHSSDGFPVGYKQFNQVIQTIDGNTEFEFTVTFPTELGKKEVTLVTEVDYTVDGEKHVDDVWTTVNVTPEIEMSLLPARYIFDSEMKPSHAGMSIINNSDAAFEGNIVLKATPGIKVTPTEIAAKVDSHGLEIFRFDVAPDKDPVPGHYTVFVDVKNKASEWSMIDVPVFAKKSDGIKVDGQVKDWSNISAVTIAKPDATGKFAYDDSNFYVSFEIEDKKDIAADKNQPFRQADSIVLAFDPLINGARTNSGGYKEDDCEFRFTDTTNGMAVTKMNELCKNISCVSKKEGSKSIYEMAIPWSELKPFEPGKGKMFAMSVLVSARNYLQWGGGIEPRKDPRLFIPVLLAD